MHSDDHPWAQVARHAASDHGVIHRDRLTALGVTKAVRERWIRTGRLELVQPRVWRVAGSPVTWRQRLRAAQLSLGPGALVSHEAAAQLHGFDRTPRDRVELLVPRARRHARLRGVTVRSTRNLIRLDRTVIDGIEVTSATRTVLDLAGTAAPGDAGDARIAAAIDSAVASAASSPEAIERRLATFRCRGQRGVRRVDRELGHAGGHTMLERRFLEVVARYRLPRPETQAWFRVEGRTIGRVDFVYRDEGIVIEVSGRRGHSSPAERAKDAQRRNELQALGLVVLEFTWDDVTRRPDHVARTVREALDRARTLTAG